MIGSLRPPTPFFISSNLESLGVEGVTGFVGILMAVESLILDLSIIRFVMQLPPPSPWKGIWKVKVPKRVAFFMWIAAHGQILTLDNLMLRGRPLENRCYLCCCNAESVNHLLLFCPIAHSLWMYMLRLFGIDSQVQSRTYYFVGFIGLGSIVLIFGIWS